ncbi:GNAT family N-acetyltransferase [Aureitalea marina]|uniref:BioF2-like acetyltransferase domain-containing protein n=1 Tax=Aureitalea marina TaxID=930804 RepID=A0A2S7KTX6_9FLAO|nr:GNAT family N-acetyltransferase [Aureitalea marina]PQB06008.1 hypothetical protein BST85_08045 [Aureitalea marina]
MYQSDRKEDWDRFIRQAKNATFLFERDFMDYHRDRFRDHSIMVYRDEQVFAVLPANKQGDQLISHQGLTYGGFVLGTGAKLSDSLKAWALLLEFLHDKGIESLKIKNIPGFYTILPSDELAYFLFLCQAKLLERDLIMLIDQDQALGFQKNRREGINKAMRKGLEVKIDNDFEAFWTQILRPNLSRKHGAEPVHSLEEIKLLHHRFPQQIKQVNIYHEDKIVAGTTVFLTRTTIHPQYVSANEDKNQLGSLDMLYDFLMREFSEGRRYFDFNTSVDPDSGHLNPGLIFWKETCGARAYAMDNYLVETASYKRLSEQLV